MKTLQNMLTLSAFLVFVSPAVADTTFAPSGGLTVSKVAAVNSTYTYAYTIFAESTSETQACPSSRFYFDVGTDGGKAIFRLLTLAYVLGKKLTFVNYLPVSGSSGCIITGLEFAPA